MMSSHRPMVQRHPLPFVLKLSCTTEICTFDYDAPVYLKHDGGYTYGGIRERDFEDDYEDDEE